MGKTYLMAVDLGTSFIKTALYGTDGRQCCLAKTPVESESPKDGVFIQHGDEILESVLICMEKIVREADFDKDEDEIVAIGFTGQMAGVIGVDENWEDVTGWSCSLDTRYLPYADEQMERLGEAFLETGGTNSPLMAPKCRWFVQDFPDQAARVEKYMLIASYIAGRLGECRIEDAVIASSYLTWTGLADIRKRQWSDFLCEQSQVRKEQLPKIVEGNAVCGYLSEKFAKRIGVKSGIVLTAGAGDKIAGCIGSGILQEGDTIFEASSYGAVSSLQKGYKPNRTRKDYDAIPGPGAEMFYLHQYFPGSGMTLNWFRETFEAGPEQQAGFEQLEEQAAAVNSGSDGLLAIGLFAGSAMPLRGEIRGAFAGANWHHEKGHFYRALLESFGYETAMLLDSIKTQYPEWNRNTPIHMIGGGARSRLWAQILADITGNVWIRHTDNDEALWGAAYLAGEAAGLFSGKDTGRKENTETIYPDLQKHQIYSRYCEIYAGLKADLEGTYRRLQELNR